MQEMKKLGEYYTLSEKNGNIYINSESGERAFPLTTKPVYLSFGNVVNVVDESEIPQALEEGLLVEVNAVRIYQEYFGWDDETTFKKVHGYDSKTHEYISSILNSIGFIEVKNGYEEEVFETSFNYGFLYNSANSVTIGKTKNGLWCAQFGYRNNIDDYNIERHYFSNKPSVSDVELSVSISNLLINFSFKKLSETITCWECGKNLHWTDINGNLNQKIKYLMDDFCGFCD